MFRTIRVEYGRIRGRQHPKGQYGGGTVLLWDRGTWAPLDPQPGRRATGRARSEFRLDGEKMHGNWALVRMNGRRAKAANGHENWLLIKERDDELRYPSSRAALVEDQPAQRRHRRAQWTRSPPSATGSGIRSTAARVAGNPAANTGPRERPPQPFRHARKQRKMPTGSPRSWRARPTARPTGRNGCTRSNTTATACSPGSSAARPS